MKHLIFLLALPLFAQQQTFSKITVTSSNVSALITATQTGAGPSLALSGGSATMGGTTFLDTSRNGTFTNLAMSGNFTGTHAQNVGTADTVTFAGVNIDADFRLDSTVTNVLNIRDSGSVSRLSLNGSGAGGFGWYVGAPSLYAQATNDASWALKAIGYPSGTSDIFVAESSGGTNYLTVGSTGNLTGAHIQDIGTTDFPILNGTFYRQTAATSGFAWSVGSTVTNVLDFKDSGSATRLTLNATGAGGFGVYVGAPSLYAQPTNNASWALKAIGYASGTADILVAESSGGVPYFQVPHGGGAGISLQSSALTGTGGGAGVGNALLSATTSGLYLSLDGAAPALIGSGVSSVSGTSPIASSGGATPAISCSTCITTAGGQTIGGTTAVDTLTASSSMTIGTNNGTTATTGAGFVVSKTGAAYSILGYDNTGACGFGVAYGGAACTSDGTLKHNVQAIGSVISQIMALRPVTYNWNSTGANGMGFIAQEVQTAIPDFKEFLVTLNPDSGKLALSITNIVPLLIRAMQEMQAEIDFLKASGK
jgi:hypothetical protein